MSRFVAFVNALNDPVVWEDILPGALQAAPKVIPRLLPVLLGHLPLAP